MNDKSYIVWLDEIGFLKESLTEIELLKILRLFGASLEAFELTNTSWYIMQDHTCLGTVALEEK
jgi:hypothetical protein